ncbi:MAG: D-inositol-3-phosphate glycosyltransferase [Chroococcidiopsis sp. SAG 2025]|uniref:glycosyltransferase family 4 protein n=1 Tax=Chroococcidiopsis sp. SAG 2025 TaxID=171389 RepID=UPI0029370C81|nr:glycosyltransferase family 4 protein [Chroococcidiopsis sp. SAG 2025]MDV2996195.1 D-inositol-3-phosphate glycosyltransferase [Chroococcidiopsis sp. SAG 2025]
MDRSHNFRIAWLLPVAWFYWQPALCQFTQIFPQTKVFTGLFPGFARGFDNSFVVEVVGKFHVLETARETTGYGSNFTYLSPSIIFHLLRLRPHVIFSSSFGVWTILALLLKPLCWWRVIIAYEGSSPGVDYRNSALRLLVRRLMVKFADACITNSQAGKAYLVDILNAKDSRVFVQPYEIPDTKTLVIQENIDLDNSQLQRPIFLFVGHIIPRKGLQILLEACKILQRQGYREYTLQVVGNGPQHEELGKFAQEHHLTDCIQWVGRVDYNLISTYFRNADVFVLPTLEDTWGVVVLEAMLLGKPVLCSTGAGTAELIVNGENGYVFDPNQPEKLAELMRQFIDRPTAIEDMGKKAQQIMSQYTPEAASKCLAQVTNLVLNN